MPGSHRGGDQQAASLRERLLKRLGLAGWVDAVIGGDTCARRKPDPQPLLFACESLRARLRAA
jgi:phosphoglycolate phosphatase